MFVFIGSQIVNDHSAAGIGGIKVEGESNVTNILQIFCGSTICKSIQSVDLIGLPADLPEGIVITSNQLVVAVIQINPQSNLIVLIYIKLHRALC